MTKEFIQVCLPFDFWDIERAVGPENLIIYIHPALWRVTRKEFEKSRSQKRRELEVLVGVDCMGQFYYELLKGIFDH